MRRVVVVSAVALTLAGVACKRSPSPPPPAPVADAAPRQEVVSVERVVVTVSVWPEDAGEQPDARQVGGRIWEELAQTTVFELARRPGGGEPPDAGPGVVRRRARVNVEIGVERGDKDSLRALATVALVWADEDEDLAPWSTHGCEGPLPAAAAMAGAAASLVNCAVGNAARGLVDKELIRRGDPALILRALDSADVSMRQVAFAAIGERRIVATVPRLLELLGSDDELVRDGAIGALVALREPRAVKPLTDLAQFKDVDMMRRVIDAVGAIGGDDARAYLELVAAGHELPAVRELAESALGRLRRRAADGG